MAKQLIIGRNYVDENHPITKDENGQPIKEGQIGQQSEKIWDIGVSRLHAQLSKTGNSKNPYNIKLLKRDSTLFVDGRTRVDVNICGNERIELGVNRYAIDLQRAIADLNSNDPNIVFKTELPSQVGPEMPLSSSYLKSQIDGNLFGIANALLVVLLMLSIALKNHPIAHVIVLILLIIVLLGDIYLYTRKHQM